MAQTDALLPTQAKAPVMSYETARSMKRPRRCSVPWHRRGGCLCCELCANRRYRFGEKHVACLAGEDPPLFRPLTDGGQH